MSLNKKNLLLAGTGSIAHEYAKVLTANHKDINVAVVSNDLKRALSFGTK